jgi:hypothetical protein
VEPPVRQTVQRGQQRLEERNRDPAGVEPSGSLARLEPAVPLVRRLREVARKRHREPLGIPDIEATGRRGAAEPLLARDRVEVERLGVDWNRTHRLRAVHEQRHGDRLAELGHREDMAVDPEDVRERHEFRPRADL